MATTFRLPRMKTMTTLAVFVALVGLSSSLPETPSVEQDPGKEWCPPCEFFFSKLEEDEENGKLTQVVRVQERGEPKTGTGMMFDWATGALYETCNYLQRLYGQKSCVVEFEPEPEMDDSLTAREVARRMVFEPALGASDARCLCEKIERVSIALSKTLKHSLPVDREQCAFSHNGGIELARATTKHNPQKSACTFADGTQPNTYDEIWRCMREANCDVTDDWLQFTVFRDPRPSVVSTYFHVIVHLGKELGDLHDFVVRELPIICEWMAVRHILFSGFLRDQSIEFWYDDAMADPLQWYYHFFYSVGLQLPYEAATDIAKAAGANELTFNHKQVDKHPGETAMNSTGVRRFEDEVGPETLKVADDILRQWLPPVILEKLGVSPAEEGAV